MKRSQLESVVVLLSERLSPVERLVFAKRLEPLAEGFAAYTALTGVQPQFEQRRWLAEMLARFLMERVRSALARIRELHDLRAEFALRFSGTVSEAERREHVLELARRLGASPRNLNRDARAFRRWFGEDTVLERLARRMADAEYEIVFSVSRMGVMAAIALEESQEFLSHQTLWQRLRIDNALRPLLVYRGDVRVRIEVFKCLARTVAALMNEVREKAFDASTLALIYRSSLDRAQLVWVQCEALKLLAVVDHPSFVKVITERLENPSEGDDIFVRVKAVSLLMELVPASGDLARLVPSVLSDPSAYVRQGLARVLSWALQRDPASSEQVLQWLDTLILKDPSPQVRAAAVRELSGIASHAPLERVFRMFVSHFSREDDSFALRVGLHAASETVESFCNEGLLTEASACRAALTRSLESLHQYAMDFSVRRWAAMARERMFVATTPGARQLKARLERCLHGLKPGRSRRVPGSVLKDVEEDILGRVLSVMTQDDFGLSVHRTVFGTRITRGDRFRWRWWRVKHELFSPMPDKRQGFRHTLGRTSPGTLKAPSSICSELTQTKVPGEPLFMPAESGWRPYLPLVDDVISSLRGGFSKKPLKVYTPEGVTELHPPRSLFRRILAYGALIWRFAQFAERRNWSEEDQAPADTYTRSLERLKFRLHYRGLTSDGARLDEDPAITRFFSLALPGLTLETWEQFKGYFVSPFENSMYQLGLFLLGVLVLFVGHRTYLSWCAHQARKSFSLVIGGWGTRGKSGAERCKAALFESLGHGVLAKTTGCEAVFIHSFPMGKAREMFIYRSYDKATIWEHLDIMRIGQRLGSDVFLWECMGLDPSFVQILQRQWARDDYSTITNTYPDHEDIQGPAGINVPEVMTHFIPTGQVLVSTEQEMKPILSEAAADLGSKMISVSWIDAGLLTPEVMERFPYEEHPANISLVLALAEELGLDRDFALKEMADRVVPDIGVLKVFPLCKVEDRRLEFVNGMSANERFASLSNWDRTGFATADLDTNPGIMIVTVVNNRADRVSRSRMFASMLVEDISADLHFVIGSNVDGLMSYVNQAWEEFSAGQSLLSAKPGGMTDLGETLTSMARRLRIPTSDAHVQQKLKAILNGLDVGVDVDEFADCWKDPDALARRLDGVVSAGLASDIGHYIGRHASYLSKFHDLSLRVGSASESEMIPLDREFKSLAREWFTQKFVVIEDFFTTGDQLVHRICREVPPGMVVRIMGMQNIKGTGLDFVHKWQAWDSCFHLFNGLMAADDEDAFVLALKDVLAFSEYGLLCEEHATHVLATVRTRLVAQTERIQAELSFLETKMTNSLAMVRAQLEKSGTKRIALRILDAIEAFLDAGDAVRRRKTANRIYRDLSDERISHERAAKELKYLSKQQAGGWLAARLGLREE